MKSLVRLLLLSPLPVLLLGCTLPAGITPVTPTSAVWSNWQIQPGTSITPYPLTQPFFLGALQLAGSQASGIFTATQTSGIPITLTSTVQDYSGTFTSSTRTVAISTNGYGFNFVDPGPGVPTPVGVIGGCVNPPGYTGVECTAIFSVPSIGVEIAPLNATFTGTLNNLAPPSYSGSAAVTITQSSTPNANGQFPLTGSVTFPAASGFGTFALTGYVSGESLALSYCSPALIGPCVQLTGTTNAAATQIAISSLIYDDPGRNIDSVFAGTLN